MNGQNTSRANRADEAAACELILTDGQRQRVDQIAGELARLMDLPGVPGISHAVFGMLSVFVGRGGMSVEQAIDTLATSLAVTQLRLSGASSRRH